MTVVLFDGVCNLCSAGVQWIARRDRRRTFRFASLQSPQAASLLGRTFGDAPLPDTMILIDHAGIHLRSDAAIRIGVALGFPWSLIGIAAFVPRRWRDAAYNWFARNRYRWFGRQETCRVPSDELRDRFLDAHASGVQDAAAITTAASP